MRSGARLSVDVTEQDLQGIPYREVPNSGKRYKRVVFDAMQTCLEMNHNPIEWAINCTRNERVDMAIRERANSAVLARVSPVLKSIEQNFDANGKFALNVIFNGMKSENEPDKS